MNVAPLIGISAFWLAVGLLGFIIPCFMRGWKNSGIAQTMIVMIAICCWMFWMLIYLHQINPLIGPQINVKTIRWMSSKWGDSPNMIPTNQLWPQNQ